MQGRFFLLSGGKYHLCKCLSVKYVDFNKFYVTVRNVLLSNMLPYLVNLNMVKFVRNCMIIHFLLQIYIM